MKTQILHTVVADDALDQIPRQLQAIVESARTLIPRRAADVAGIDETLRVTNASAKASKEVLDRLQKRRSERAEEQALVEKTVEDLERVMNGAAMAYLDVHKKLLANAQAAERVSDLERTRAVLEGEIGRLRAAQETELARAKKDHESELAKLRAAQEAEVGKLRALLEAEAARAQIAKDAELEKLKSTVDAMARAHASMEMELTATRNALTEQTQATRDLNNIVNALTGESGGAGGLDDAIAFPLQALPLSALTPQPPTPPPAPPPMTVSTSIVGSFSASNALTPVASMASMSSPTLSSSSPLSAAIESSLAPPMGVGQAPSAGLAAAGMSPPMGASLSTGPDEVDKSLAANMDLMLEDMSEALPMPGLNAPRADAQKNPSSDIEIDMSVSFDDMLSAAGSGGGDRGTSLDDDTVIAATDRLKTMKGAAPEVIRMAGILSHESWGRVSVRELADIANLDLELVRRRVNELKAQGYVEVVEGA